MNRARFTNTVAEHRGWTETQFRANEPRLCRRTPSGRIGFDISAIAGVSVPPERRGLLTRQVSAEDRRAQQLAVMAEGAALPQAIQPDMQSVQAHILAPMPKTERAEMMRMWRV